MSRPPTVPRPIKTLSETLVGTPLEPSSGEGELEGEDTSALLVPEDEAVAEIELALLLEVEEWGDFEGEGLGLGLGLGLLGFG